MAHVQRAGGVGRYKLHQHALATRWLLTEARARAKHFAHDLLLGLWLEPDIDEARAGNIHRLHPTLEML